MNIFNQPIREDWSRIMQRPDLERKDINILVKQIFDIVKADGDNALQRYTQRFDQVALNSFLVGPEKLQQASKQIPETLKNAIQLAKRNIEQFHLAQRTRSFMVETVPGVFCWQETRPIERIGIYIPGGSAALFSTVLMLAVPARIAGCREIILCTPPDRKGNIHPAILYAAQLTGVTSVFKLGGIQAIAAMTFGTESVPAVHKIFGPGNSYVVAAKQNAFLHGVAVDLPAGPSELLIVADESALPAFVAADLLAQAEHGPDSQVLCLVNKTAIGNQIKAEIELQLTDLPRRQIAAQALAHSRLVVLQNREDTLDFINEYAPEHLMICTRHSEYYARNIQNAGSVFMGNYSPESAGDYASGTNHTLPTNGFAKAYSGVNLDAFLKKITFQKITKEGLKQLGKAIEHMAEAEQLQGHKHAVTLRLNTII